MIPVNETSVDAAGSHCNGEKEDILKVSWKDGNAFEMTFRANDTKYDLSSFVITLNSSRLFNDSMGELLDISLIPALFKSLSCVAANQTLTTLSYNNESFDIPANFSYHCNREQQLNATDGSSLFFVSKVQFEAFRKNTDQKFSAAKDCDSNITPDIVPIAVGISLIALIVVVLIAYMVGRRRQQARGYLNIM